MALQLILGSSGQGKTEYLMEEVIRESMKNPDQFYYVIAPEQFGVEMQRQIIARHPRHGFSNIDILSFYRLAYRVFEEAAYEPKEILEDLGVSMVLKKVLLDHQEELKIFRRSVSQHGFLDELKSMLMECMNYGVTPFDMTEVCQELEGHPGLKEKCQELGMIFSWFEESIQEHYMVAGQILDVLKDMVADSKMLREGIFYMDGFTGFTPIQLDFLRELLPKARGVNITITIPYIPTGKKKFPQEDLFAFSEKSIYALWNLCRDSGTEILSPLLLQKEEDTRFGENLVLSYLEKNIFRREAKPYDAEQNCIHAVACLTPEEEAEFVLRKVEELVRQKGYRYRDFAILMGNESDYPSAFLRKSQGLQIPLFVDSRQKMAYHSGIETIRALFHLAEMDYSYQSVFRYLKSGMSDLSGEDTDYLEKYVFTSGIRGLSMWQKPFYRRLNLYNQGETDRLESLRLQLLAETQAFVAIMKEKEATVRQRMTVLFETLSALQFPQKLAKRAEIAEEEGDYVKSMAYQQFIKELYALMDKMVTIFGEEKMNSKEMAEMFDAGLEAISLAAPPLSMDQVILGDLKRTRLPEIKVLFFVGMNDGDIPPVPEDSGLICDDEKRILDEHGITLSLNLTERVLEDEYYLYLAFSKASEELYLSTCQMASDGSSRRPSTLFKILQNMFPDLKMQHYPDDMRQYYFREADSREYLIRQLRKWYEDKEIDDVAFFALVRYWQEKHPEELTSLYEQMKTGIHWMPLSSEIVDQLYGMELIGSVTKMEQFARCPYQFFCQFGLGLSEWQEYKIQPVDIGDLFHAALEYFSEEVKARGYHWKDIPEDVEEEMIQNAINAKMNEKENLRDVMESSARNNYKKKMVERIMKKTISVLRYHLQNSSFEPDRFELSFSPKDGLESTKIPLSDGRRIAFQGVIDRVDICEEDDRIYLKIIDYKSGNKKFAFHELYHGLQLQLIVYLNAAMEYYREKKQKKVEPAGVFYYHIQDPIQKESDVAGDKAYKAYRMSGFANSDQTILNLMEKDRKDMESIEVSFNKDGSFKKNAPVMSSEDFYMVEDYVTSQIQHMGERIYQGEIAATPYQLGDATPCEYCDYRAVCGFEYGMDGHCYRVLTQNSNEDILEKIREEMG